MHLLLCWFSLYLSMFHKSNLFTNACTSELKLFKFTCYTNELINEKLQFISTINYGADVYHFMTAVKTKNIEKTKQRILFVLSRIFLPPAKNEVINSTSITH